MADGIQVSVEEQRFLRRTFRRFALPYLLLFAAIAWLPGFFEAEPAGISPEQVAALEQQIAELGESIAAFGGRIDAVGSELTSASQRVAGLEETPSGASDASLDQLRGELRRAARRVNELDKRLKAQALPDRIDALAARMSRIEEELVRSAARMTTPPASQQRPAAGR